MHHEGPLFSPSSSLDTCLRRVSISYLFDSYCRGYTFAFMLYIFCTTVALYPTGGTSSSLMLIASAVILSTLLSSFLYILIGGVLFKRYSGDQSRWLLQCLVIDPIMDVAFGVVKKWPIRTFIAVSIIAEIATLVQSSVTTLLYLFVIIVISRQHIHKVVVPQWVVR